MKFNNTTNVEILNEPLDVDEVIRKKSVMEMDEEPLYIFNVSDIIEKHRNWQRCMPRVLPFYAVKCNDNAVVLQTLAALGTGFDCASKGEISKVMSYGVTADRIIFANPTKPNSHINFASKMNVDVMTVDSDFELYKIQKLFPAAKLVLRIRCDAKVAQCPLGEKFGCHPDVEAPNLIQLARELNLNMIGISFHVGSGCMDPPVYSKAIATARKLFDMAQTIGFDFKLLDIGGGFPGDSNTDISEIASIIESALRVHFPSPDVTVIAEPGRYYVSSAFTLACRIHSKRNIVRNNVLENIMYFINDGVYGSFNCILYDHKVAHPKPLRKDLNNEDLFKSSIWGPTCDALDQVCESILLPNLAINDIVIFENMGAYTLPIASPFNGFPLPRVEYYIERKHLEDINATTASHEYILLRNNE